MRFLHRLLLPLLLFAVGAPPALAASDLSLNGEGLLWRITAPNGAVSHLYGTVHSSDPRALALPEAARRAFDISRSAAFELVLDEALEQRMAQAMVLPRDMTLSRLVGPELFGAIASTASDYGISVDSLQTLKPWALISIFSFPPEELLRRQQGLPSLDERLQDDARLSGKELIALESPEDQIGVFESMSVEQQVDIIASMLDDAPDVGRWFEQLLQLYLDRRVAAIYEQLVAQSTPDDPHLVELFEQRFIFARNLKMAAALNPYLARGGIFVAVGALHLPGKEGLVNLLAGRGYKLQRIY